MRRGDPRWINDDQTDSVSNVARRKRCVAASFRLGWLPRNSVYNFSRPMVRCSSFCRAGIVGNECKYWEQESVASGGNAPPTARFPFHGTRSRPSEPSLFRVSFYSARVVDSERIARRGRNNYRVVLFRLPKNLRPRVPLFLYRFTISFLSLPVRNSDSLHFFLCLRFYAVLTVFLCIFICLSCFVSVPLLVLWCVCFSTFISVCFLVFLTLFPLLSVSVLFYTVVSLCRQTGGMIIPVFFLFC